MNMLAGLSGQLPRLLPLLLSWRHAPVRRHAAGITRPHFDGELPSNEEADTAATGATPAPCACGWFDSSHDLRHGLLVREHAGDDCLGTELPLAQWLELHLHGWRSQAAGAATA